MKKSMNHEEIKKMAIDTYELGLTMSETFAKEDRHRDYMILAIMGCISGLVNSDFKLMTLYTGAQFKMMREAKNLTLREVEYRTSISNSYLSQLETGKVKKPSYNTVCKLIDLYTN